ncbi:hypothetical protein CFP65_1947 [Kitasatospora sp. MMS16-BH015]|uniref:hypothetical protein n=1 Tax=Kitasatospora sp. MMS16-BH015 TaxID=2018025 RepID=UPI000CA0CF6E|nr:hypothetical protein [Kitasatospora sp. MMS16-BH015]AUG76815.1 hypothetical protein CFP65_1947 [Kitasatospora sp. MMS16-BH015]
MSSPMMPDSPTVRPGRPYAFTPRTGEDPESLAYLVSTSRRMGRFWPSSAPSPQPKAGAPVGVSVPARAQRLVAGMTEYGG